VNLFSETLTRVFSRYSLSPHLAIQLRSVLSSSLSEEFWVLSHLILISLNSAAVRLAMALILTDEVSLPLRAIRDLGSEGLKLEEALVITQCGLLGMILYA
jgi:hypothetical protein